MMRKLALFIALLMVIGVMPMAVNAAPFQLADLEVNGVEVIQGQVQSVFVDRDSRANVRVEFKAFEDVQNVKVRAWIGGYENGNIQDTQGPFDVKSQVTRVVNLALEIPDDIEAGKEYTLHVDIFNEKDSLPITFNVKLDVEEKRHLVELFDVLFTPGLTVDSGQPLFVNARVKNKGALEEKDIRVSVKIPELGIEQAVYVDKLVTEAKEDRNTASSASTNDIWLQIPEDAERKNYKLLVAAEFNGRRDKSEKEYTLTVNGVDSKDEEDARVLASASADSKNVIPGETAVYEISLANLNQDNKVLKPEVVGLKGWADVEFEPGVLNIGSGEVSQMFVKVTPNEDASGEKVFVLKLIENSRTVKEMQLKAVAGRGAVAGTALTSGLGLVFLVLVVILILLAIIIAVRKGMKTDTEAPMEGGETKSYY